MSNEQTCHFEGCTKPIFVQRTPVGPCCNGHYKQLKEGKILTPLRAYNPRAPETVTNWCPEDECDRPSWHKTGRCQSHQRQIYAGEPCKPIRNYSFQIGNKCKYPECEKAAKSRGYCSTHYRSNWGECIEPDCHNNKHNKSTGLCVSHYNQLQARLKDLGAL